MNREYIESDDDIGVDGFLEDFDKMVINKNTN